ncbi:MAG: sigma-70 family RNA polymerase sigma factor [Lentimicrobiaceae bacterium]|nr:sigma-70 family RNA polymerase sigma factor [Lentimicrobiaceae bacterium]
MRYWIDWENAGDEDLLSRYIRTGDMKYFGILYCRYIPLLYGLSLKYLKTPEDAEDAVMQLFGDLVEKVKRQEIACFKNWLYRVAGNHCLQLLRKRHPAMVSDWKEEPVDSAEFLNLLEEHGDEIQLKALHHCMEHLPDQQKNCIREFFLAEKSYAEISEQKGYGLKSVKSYIQNGKRNLKSCIEKTTKEWGYCPI